MRSIEIVQDDVRFRYEALEGGRWRMLLGHGDRMLPLPTRDEDLPSAADVIHAAALCVYHQPPALRPEEEEALVGLLERNGYERTMTGWRRPDGVACSSYSAVQDLVMRLGGEG